MFATLAIIAGVPLTVLGLFALIGFRYVPNRRIGVVEKRFSSRGSVESGLIALGGEAGYQPRVLRGGLHWLMPIQYRVHILPLVTIPQGQIGYVFARDGRPLPPTQTLGSNVKANDFEDAEAFLKCGGQRGPQRQILREGMYAINLALFLVFTRERNYYLPLNHDDPKVVEKMAQTIGARNGFQPLVISGAEDEVGIVTTHDGPALGDGEIIAPVVGNDPLEADSYHNNFQDPERFLRGGGRRGRQLQVLIEGTYYLNWLFVTVERIPKTVVEVGTVGVVVWYAGETGADLSGVEYKHGELVRRGERGVWSEPLLPGKYPFNTCAGKVVLVPTTNIILKWIRSETGEHGFDENLAEVSLITKDAFEPSLPLSVVIHIDYRKAPLVIQRFGDIQRLVEQTLDPMVAAYFKNIGQTRTLIQLLQDRSRIQELAGEAMKEKFAHYNLELEEVLIGTPTSSAGDKKIEEILAQLRTRQIAEEQVETYERQEKAALKERELREAEALARQQQKLTESELEITIQGNQGKAELQLALQHAERIKAMADAEASRVRAFAEAEAAKVRAVGEAEAERAARVGVGEAIAIEEQVRAYGGPRFQLTQQVMARIAQAIEHAGIDVVPKVVIGGSNGHGPNGDGNGGGNGGSFGSGNVLEALLALLLSERLTGETTGALAPRPPQAESLRSELLRKIGDGRPAAGAPPSAPA